MDAPMPGNLKTTLERLFANRRYILIVLGLIIAAGLGTRWLYLQQVSEEQTKTPVYVAIMLEKKGTEDQPFMDSVDAQRGAELCIAEINAQGLPGKNGPLELIPDFYYDENTLDAAAQSVDEVLKANRALAVIGHGNSTVSYEMGKTYAAEGIPAITASSILNEVTHDNEWYFRVIPGSSMQAQQMAQYLYYAMNVQDVTIIELENDAATQQLSSSFRSTYSRLKGKVSAHHYFGGLKDNQTTPEMVEIIDLIEAANRDYDSQRSLANPGAVIFMMRAPEAAQFIIEMRQRGMDNIFFGISAFANRNFLAAFEGNAAPGSDPYQYANGVYALAPIVFDTTGESGQDFLQHFREQYNNDDPGMKAATNCDAIRIIAKGIANAKLSGRPDDIKTERTLLRDAIRAIDTYAEAVDGVTGKIYFNAKRDPVKPIDTSIYQNGERISAISQIVEIDKETAKRLAQQTQEKNPLLHYDNRHFRVTDVVYVGVDINQVSELDIQNGTYVMDFYVWFRSREPMEPQDFEFLSLAEPIEFGSPVVETIENGISYRAYHAKGTFKGSFRYQDYPFDRQLIGLIIKHKFKNSQELLLIPDTIGMRGITTREIVARLQRQNVIHALQGDWVLDGTARIGASQLINDSTLGNPDLVNRNTNIPYSQIHVNFGIKRNGNNYILKNLLPLFFLVGLAQLAFFSKASDYGKMYDIVTSVILTAAFFQLGLTESLPSIGYTTAMDWMFYLLYFLCIAQITVILFIKTFVENGKEAEANRIVSIARLAYPLLVLLGGYGVYLYFWN
jgi:branched-chain amino acid transport system substrate-binding protein